MSAAKKTPWAAAALLLSALPCFGAVYTETFEGPPGGLARWLPAGWDAVIGTVEPAAHIGPFPDPAPDCGGLQNFSVNMNEEEYGTYKCPGHLMTKINSNGYGFLSMTPNQLLDFSNGEAVLRWDMSTLNMSGRNWIEMHLLPWEDHVLLAAERWGNNRAAREIAAIKVEGNCAGRFGANGLKISTELRRTLSGNYTGDEQLGSVCTADIAAPSAAVYETFELRVTRTHVKFGMPSRNNWWLDKDVQDLGWNKAVIQFGPVAYKPLFCEPAGGCGPTAFHVDNFSVSPAVPFTILRADQRLINSATVDTARFAAPAPAGAQLKFTGRANALEVSADGGAWQRAALRPQPTGNTEGDEHEDDYAVALPAGTTQVRFRGTRWWGGDWEARNIAVYALSGTSAPAARPGDLDRDGDVDVADLSRLLNSWGSDDPAADLDANGQVGVQDLSRLLSNWGAA